MQTELIVALPGTVNVVTTNNTGLSVEHWVERALERIVFVGDQSIPAIRDQAEAFKGQVRAALDYYMRQAIRSDRTTLYNLLLQQGETQMAEIIRRLK